MPTCRLLRAKDNQQPMPTRDWTIDTYVLHKATELDLVAIDVLSGLLHLRQRLVLDAQRDIVAQYDRCISRATAEKRSGVEFVKAWLKQMRNCAETYDGRMPSSQAERLADIGFDRSDWPFVAACHRSPSKKLVSEDTDYNSPVRELLRDDLAVEVLSVAEAQTVLRPRNAVQYPTA